MFHCFSGDAELARHRADDGWYLSFAGTVTFKNAENLREALDVPPRDRILVETDAPYLTPDAAPRPPERALPDAAHAAVDGRAYLGTDLDDARAQIASNTERSTAPGMTSPCGGGDRAVNAHRHAAEGDDAATPRLLGPAEIRDLAELLDVQPTKKLGQNFVHRRQHRAPHRADGRACSAARPCSRSARGSAR